LNGRIPQSRNDSPAIFPKEATATERGIPAYNIARHPADLDEQPKLPIAQQALGMNDTVAVRDRH
jgi:hypothetical protein